MAAQTGEIQRVGWALPESAPNKAHTVLAGQTLWAGSLSMMVAGKIRTYVAGTANLSMGGVMQRTYVAGGTDLVLPEGEPVVMKRGVFGFLGLTGDLPTEADIGKSIPFIDNNTVKKTLAINELTGVLRDIQGGYFWVEI